MSITISVLMPCFNAERFIQPTLDSLLHQTDRDFVLIVVDDGSNDCTVTILEAYADRDSRIQLTLDKNNAGIIYRRNQLLSLCETELACWADADDLYHPERLAKQRLYMKEHPDIGVCSCYYNKCIDGRKIKIAPSEEYFSRENMLFYNNVFNPGAMFRMSVIKGNDISFDAFISGASDYKFWSDLRSVTRFGQVKEFLVDYRVHSDQESSAQVRRQLHGHVEIVQQNLISVGVHLSQEDIASLLVFPREKLGIKMTQHEHKQALVNVDLIKDKCRNVDGNKLNQVLIRITRAHCKRMGISAFWHYIRRFKWQGLADSEHFGMTLFIKMLKTSLRS